jgi:hypothetical protein
MKTGENKKAMIRNQVFHEINDINKKIGTLNTSQIASIWWPSKKGMAEVPVKTWLEEAENANFWNLIE